MDFQELVRPTKGKIALGIIIYLLGWFVFIIPLTRSSQFIFLPLNLILNLPIIVYLYFLKMSVDMLSLSLLQILFLFQMIWSYLLSCLILKSRKLIP